MISISWLTWIRIGMRMRSDGQLRKESGAFLLAKKGSRRISDFVSYLDLDPNSNASGIIKFDGSGHVVLSKYCLKNNLVVIADIHTHPGKNVGQSTSDRAHPMVKISGHIGLIVPNFFKRFFVRTKDVGVYEFKGNALWQNHSKSSYFKMHLL